MKYILFINDKMPTTVGILSFINRINTTFEFYKQEIIVIFQYFSFLRAIEISCSVELSMKKLYNLYSQTVPHGLISTSVVGCI